MGIVLNQDWHIHTAWSPCAQPANTISAISAALNRAGVVAAGLADHFDHPRQLAGFQRLAANHRRVLAERPVFCDIRVGAEATMLTPARCALPAGLAAELDYVLISCNHFHNPNVEKPARMTPLAYADHALDMIEGALQLDFAFSIAHPFLNLYADPDLAFETLRAYNLGRLRALLAEAGRRGVAFEMNPYVIRLAEAWFRDFVAEARAAGVRFTLGSDAHDLSKIGYQALRQGRTAAAICEAAGLRAGDLRRPAEPLPAT